MTSVMIRFTEKMGSAWIADVILTVSCCVVFDTLPAGIRPSGSRSISITHLPFLLFDQDGRTSHTGMGAEQPAGP
ncbi:hypothetical protein L249_1621 [Ophiocordyceps polyrhachis-furcata BCC 54312]|uniref:Uncharacterized protein n=1 Tax=Ophiocordyceps polyrhachis-furcata BCC 54312 TaxID=1330021 RepID=A0A367KZH8_9HYPO|nr:hypothetical protein L249_1621 [Ophiocordyceps polyrhachis-furcata BCC 54312]